MIMSEEFELFEHPELTEQELQDEDWGIATFNSYLMAKQYFLETEYFKNCTNKELCEENNFHECGCFHEYLHDWYKQQDELKQQYIKENPETYD